MIFVSTTCLIDMEIIDGIELLHENGFSNIELSGGLNNSAVSEEDLTGLKTRYKLNYICHNHFPPAKEAFVLNLASLNDDVYQRTLRHLEKAIRLSRKIGGRKLAFHAGFFLDPKIHELGKGISYRELFNREKCLRRFCEGFGILKKIAGDLELYIENNIISKTNLEIFKNVNPSMLSTYEEYIELREMIEFKLLLDIAHLKVSAASFDLNFENELDKMIEISDYLHISDNNGLADQHLCLSGRSDLLRKLKNCDLRDKTITLEVRGGMQNLGESYNLIKDILK